MGHFIEKPSQVNSSMKMFIVLFLAAVAFAEPEAEAEADPAWLYSTGLPYSSLTRGIYNPVVYSKPVVYQKPVVPAVAPIAATSVYTYPWQKPVVYQKPVVTNVSPVVSTYAAPAVAAPAQVVTNYKSPVHYTAHSTLLGQTLGLPKYIAKNGPVEHVVHKREAEAEPEADPQLLLSTGVLPTTYHHTSVLPAVPAVPAVKTIAAPVTYTHVASPLVKSVVTAPLVKSVVTPVVAKSPVLTYSTVNNPVVYSHAGVYNAIGQSNVAITPFGATHPSNVGPCLNYMGQQVPC